MEITIFAKRRNTKEGKKFYTYLSTLTKKNGEQVTSAVRFAEACGAPKPDECPMNIVLNKEDVNMGKKPYMKADGTVVDSYTLWVNNWSKGSEFVDHSMDEFM